MVRRRTNGGFPFWQLRGEFERAMSDLFTRSATATPWTQERAFPPVNLWEEGDQLFAEAELPGVKSEDLDVSVTGNELTLREHEVLEELTQGSSNQEIARQLSIAESTVKTHITNILCKLEVSDRTQAVVAALDRGLIKRAEA